jgi:hypothetical protein
MTTSWEYRTITPVMGATTTDEQLCDMGSASWELVSIVQLGNLNLAHVFKRMASALESGQRANRRQESRAGFSGVGERAGCPNRAFQGIGSRSVVKTSIDVLPPATPRPRTRTAASPPVDRLGNPADCPCRDAPCAGTSGTNQVTRL